MTGAELADLRTRLGYTQGALAVLLGVSTPTVSRMEAAREVPPEHVARLARLEPAPANTSARGAYKRQQPSKAAPARRVPTPRPKPTPPPLPAARPEGKPAPTPDIGDDLPLLSAEEAGAHLLEVPEGGSSLRGYWERVNACLTLLEWRRAARAGRPPCPR